MQGRIVGEGAKAKFYIDKKEVTKAEFDAAFPSKGFDGGTFGGTPTTGWPIHSMALGVHPEQVKEATEHAKRIGVPTEHTPDGKAILTDRGHRKRYLKAMGFRDNNGGYGD